MKWWFKKPKKLNETTRLYALYGESANLDFLDSTIKDNTTKINENTQNIQTNKNNIQTNANRIEAVKNQLDNLPPVDLTDVNNRINTNIRNIATNVSNINNLNTKVNKITNDLSNANIASYKGTWNSSTTYNVGDIVNVGDKFYLAVVRNSNSQPPTNGNDKWKLLTFTVDTSSFITDTALNPLRNDISTNRNNISTLTNRVNNLSNPIKQHYFNTIWERDKFNYKYYTSGSIRTHVIEHRGYTLQAPVSGGGYRGIIEYEIRFANGRAITVVNIFEKSIFGNYIEVSLKGTIPITTPVDWGEVRDIFFGVMTIFKGA